MMNPPSKVDRLKALDDLEHAYRMLFEGVWVEQEAGDAQRLMRRALAVLHAAEKVSAD